MALDPDGTYANLRDTVASPLLQEFGFPAAIWVKSAEVFDPVQGLVTQPAVWGVNPTSAVYGGGGSGQYAGVTTDAEAKTLSRKRKKEVYLDASQLGSVEPTPDDLFQDENGLLLEIMSVENTNPGGVAVIWRIKVAK